MRDLLSAPDLLTARDDGVQEAPARRGPEAREQERRARKLHAREREGQRPVDADQAGAIELAALRDRRQRIDDHGRLLRDRLGELPQQRSDQEQELRLQEGLEAFRASVPDALAEPSVALKQQVLRLVVDRIVVDAATLTVHHIVPTGPVRLQTGQATTRSGRTGRWPWRPRLRSNAPAPVRFARGRFSAGCTTRTRESLEPAPAFQPRQARCSQTRAS